MRKTFFKQLHKQMTINTNIYVLTADLGYKGFDEIAKDYHKRYFNVGASEQTMLDIAVGMAYQGKIPVCYSITPFLIFRAFETIRTYIIHEKLHVILVGSGRNKDYEIDGISHDASDIKPILSHYSDLKSYYPNTLEEIPQILNETINSNLPSFISLERK